MTTTEAMLTRSKYVIISKKSLIPDDTMCSKILLRTEVNDKGLYERSLGPFLCKTNIITKRQSV